MEKEKKSLTLVGSDSLTSAIDHRFSVGLNPIGVRDFFSFSVWVQFLSSANAQKVLFGIFIQRFKPLSICA